MIFRDMSNGKFQKISLYGSGDDKIIFTNLFIIIHKIEVH